MWTVLDILDLATDKAVKLLRADCRCSGFLNRAPRRQAGPTNRGLGWEPSVLPLAQLPPGRPNSTEQSSDEQADPGGSPQRADEEGDSELQWRTGPPPRHDIDAWRVICRVVDLDLGA